MSIFDAKFSPKPLNERNTGQVGPRDTKVATLDPQRGDQRDTNIDKTGVDCAACETGELLLYTTEDGSLVEHPTRQGFFMVYCAGCGVVGGIDSLAHAHEWSQMRLGKVRPAARFSLTKKGAKAAAR